MSRAARTPSPPAARSTPTTRSATSPGHLTVTPAALTITANNQTKVYGAALPTLTASYTGFVNGDTSASLTTQPTLTTTATASSHVSGSPTPSPPRRGRHRLHHQLRRRDPHRHAGAADDHRQQPDQGLRRGAADADGQLHGLRQRRHLRQPDHSADAHHDGHGQQPCLGQPVRHHRRGAVDSDYTISYVAGTLTVTPAALTITPTAQNKPYGEILSFGSGSTQFTSTGLQNGETIGSVTLAVSDNGGAATAPVGSYTITASAATGGTFTASNYSITYATGKLTVSKAATTTVVTPSTATVSLGQSATFMANVSSADGSPPDGYVQFFVDGVAYGSAVALVDGTAEIAITKPAGSYTIAAQYTGDTNFAATLSADETKAKLTIKPL